MTDIAGRLSGLSPKKRELLLRRLLAKPAARRFPDAESQTPDRAPVSFAQRRLWFLHRLDPGSAAYNLPFAVRLSGTLDAGALARTLAEIVRRHEPLRTTFEEAGGEPVQVIAPPAAVSLPHIDLSALPLERRRPEALRLASEEAARPFDLARGPLFRPLLVREEDAADTGHLISLTMHHVVTDGWSTGVLLREVAALYPAFVAGLPSPLPRLPARYADFAARQRRWLEGPDPAALLAWWKERLAGAPVLELPTDRPRPEARRGRGTMETFAFPPEGVVPLRELARARGATLYMGLFAAFQVLLHRYTGQDDLVVGSPVAGRGNPETQDLIGFFVNAVALRGRVDGSESFRELLERTRAVCLEAWAHQDLPFEKLVEEIQPERSLARSPLFQVILSLEERPAPSRLAGLETEPVTLSTGASKLDLTLMLAERGGRIDGFAERDTDLFDAATVQRLLGHFRNLIAGAAADPDRPLAELPMLDVAERHQLAVEAGAREEIGSGNDLYALFAAQAERRPDAVALSHDGVDLTYGELARRAEELAQDLQDRGVGPDVPVALWFDREPGLIVAILGVLAAGGAYVPLDPAWPEERVEFVLADSGAGITLRSAAGSAGIPAGPIQTKPELVRPAGMPALPGNLAYVIYTSGSTGRPKGVGVTHRNLTRLLEATRPWFHFGEGDVWTLFHSYAFDFSVWEIWGALAFGGRLVIVPWETSRSPEAFADLLEREGVTVLNQTPSAFYGLVDLERRTGRDICARAPSLAWVIFGGEALDAGRLAPWWERHALDRPRLVNMYGITETTVHVTFRAVGPEDAWSGAGSGVGRPISDLSIHVLGPGSEPRPLGVPGEMHVGGAGLARGYLGRPDLTAERFVPDPFSGQAGARLYRSGDLARLRPSGELEYLGRVDRQVKVRGFRIEPGEIEAALAALPGVCQAVVLVRDGSDRSVRSPGDRRLVAYVTGDATAAELRQSLRKRLPDYMVPASFVILEALPLTVNGKVDRNALAAGPLPDADAGETWAAPRTPAEELLAGLWSELLGRDQVGRNDDFFELGGHSLLATQLVSRVRQTFGVEIPLRTVFETPTLEAMAAAIPGRGEDLAPPIVPVPRGGDLPLSFAQQRLWFLDRLVPGNPFYVMAFGLRLEGPLDVAALREALLEIVRRHESLRTTFHVVEGEPRQRVAEGMDPGLPVIDLSGVDGREGILRELGRTEARRPFDLESGPLLRAFLARLGDEDHTFLLHLHHIVADGWSMGVLRRELSVLYEAFAAGRPSTLPELPVQYPDFAVWQRSWMAGETLERQLAFWRRALDGAPPVLDLPSDHPRPAVETFRGAVSGFVLPEGLVRRLRALSRGLGATLSMTALAAYDLLLARYTGRDDVVVGSAVANRNRRETEGLIGFFVNLLALRTRLSGGLAFAELAARVRETSLDAFAHQDIPFEKLIEELQLPRGLAHQPLCQAMYAFQNFPLPDAEVSGLALTSLEGEATDTGTAKADLTLFLAEDPENPEDIGLRGWIEYNADLFEPATILRLARHLTTLLEAAAADPGRSIAGLPMLNEAERHQLAVEAGAREESDGDGGTDLYSLFAAQAERRPDAIALSHEGVDLTYGELARRAEELARDLQNRGIRPDVPVALRFDREPGLIVAILGVLAAGGAYVPLDPAWPEERVEFVLADSGAEIVLRGTDLSPLGSPLPDGGRAMGEGAGARGYNLAYVIYTSGSTGRPKGVGVTHRNATRLLAATRPWFHFGEDDVWTLFHSYAFDFSVWEIWGALAFGGRLVIVPWETSRSPEAFADLLERERVTVLNQTPSAFYGLVDLERRTDRAAGSSLSWVIFGGEALEARRLAPWWKRHAPDQPRLVNMYGITETTVHVTFRAVGPEDAWSGAGSGVGRPIPDLSVHVLGPGSEPAPLGVPGELCVGGAGLARGYLGRPDLTAERFVPDPFGGEAGARLYRSGDLARLRPSGELEYLGRVDRQVKVRGFRIEPGEIEAALAALPGVRQAVVLVRDGSDGSDRSVRSSGDRRLVACVTGDATAAELRRSLRERLPDYMVPASFVILEALPLTVNGKVDRKALASGPLPDAEAGETWAAPRTLAEELLAGLWSELLGPERIGRNDDFFALGGHSLLATRLVSRVRETFGVEIPLRTLFEAPTLAAMAAAIPQPGEADLAPPIVPLPREGALPLSFAQERLWFLDQLDAGRSPWNLSVAVRFQGRLGLARLEAALNEMVRRHEALRTAFGVAGGRTLQIIVPSLRLALPLTDLSALRGERQETELARWIGEDFQRPFDLAAGPLIRATALRLGPEDHAVAITLHHIVSDGWSMGVLIRELGALYQGEALAELPVQYADFAVWQREWLQGETLERQLGWWRERLAAAPPLLALPLDRPRPSVHTFRGRRRRGELAAETVEALSALGRRAGATLFMTLLAVWKALLFRITGEPDLLVGTPVANRNRAETEGLIGFFVNTLVMRTDLSDGPCFSALLERVREAALDAYGHQDLPFEKLVGELAPERNPAHTPVFQVFFTFEEGSPVPPDLPGLRLTPIGAESRTVKFDLTLLSRRLDGGNAGGVELVLGYNSDLFHPATAERLLGHLRTLIEGIAADPERAVSELPILSESQTHQVLLGWNDTAAEIEPLPLHRIFEETAARWPDRTAVVTANETVSYGELDDRANRLAHHLQSQGVAPEVRVGILLDRSPDLVTSILAVLKAGGAWVSLDPGLPQERLDFLIADAGCKILITEETLTEGPLGPPASLPAHLTHSPDHLAYLLYTSGSTGTPKGVAVTHRGLASLARAQAETFGLGPEDRILQFSSPVFDASVSELAIAWQSGAALHLAPVEEMLPGASLAFLLRDQGITNVTVPPSALAVTPLEDLPELRSLVVAGEPCPSELAERWSGGRRFTNAYGPTEATVCATAAIYEPGSLRLTLGRPIANARTVLLNPRGIDPVPMGVAGEICLAGPGLARGYLGRPDLTAERFMPDPWSPEPGARLYRTGDLARWLPDGRIELLGRIDEQVKVRGFRVEPGEVRAALLALPQVAEAEIMAPKDDRGERRLVAWVVPKSEITAADLRRFLEDRLPGWLVPSRVVFLDALPRTASGKVDRRALPPPDGNDGRTVAGRLEPANEAERFLLDLWREVLGRQAIGMEEGFFDLGGTSLQAAVLTNTLQERLGDYVYAVALFDAPTIAELALYLERHYPAAVARLRGEQPVGEMEHGVRTDGAMAAELRRLIGIHPKRLSPVPRNPRAVFILSPPRSGSTLLRVMLAGNRHLFAPPELELLGFGTLGERAAELSGRFSLWKEGAVRAVMEARGIDLDEAAALLAEMEAADLPVSDLYRRLQEWTAGRTLVDKTPSYALDRSILDRAEETFEEPLYLHLLRHPCGMIASFEEAKLEQVFFRPRHNFTRRQLAELIWRVSQENVLAFLAGVPAGRRFRVRFEDLVRRPRAEVERICAFLDVPFEGGMLDPYASQERKMTDGVHALSKMLGDVKFHTHANVDPAVADRWKTLYGEDFLGEETSRLARSLGYEERTRNRFSSLVRLREGGPEPPLFLVHPMGGSVFCYRELASLLGDRQPVYGLQSRGLGMDEETDETVEAMTAAYLEEMRRVQPAGPYRLGGWSLGGVVAFEMARRLEEQGQIVDLLAVLDAVAPGVLPPVEINDGLILRGFLWEIQNQAGYDLGIREEDLQALSTEEGMKLVLQRSREAGALPADFGVDQALRLWRVVRANLLSVQTYRPRTYSGSALLFVVENPSRPDPGPDLGWRPFIRGGIESVTIEARHSTMLQGAALQTIADGLRERL